MSKALADDATPGRLASIEGMIARWKLGQRPDNPSPAAPGSSSPNERAVELRVFDAVEAGAGPPLIPADATPDRLIPIAPQDFLAMVGFVPTSPYQIRVRGDSMLPWLRDGGAAWVEPCDRVTVPGRYAVSLGDGLLIKRIAVLRKGRIDLLSDNRAYPPIRLRLVDDGEGEIYQDLDDGETTHLRVHGRVIYPTDDGQAVLGQAAEVARIIHSR